jgi:hypothetical protein
MSAGEGDAVGDAEVVGFSMSPHLERRRLQDEVATA